MSFDRRKVLALGGLGAVAGVGTGALGAELNLHAGITITIQRLSHWDGGGWGVAVPDWDSMGTSWVAGQIPPVKIMPMAEFLSELEKLGGS